MKPHRLGTVLPTVDDLAINDAWAARNADRQATVAAAHPILSRITPVTQEGERRWYVAPNKFAIVSRALRVLWFEVRNGRVFSSTAPKA